MKSEQRADHACEMTHSQWKRTAPAPGEGPSHGFHADSIAYITPQLLPWLIFIDSIKVQISNECDNHSGPLARNPQDFILILGGDDISRTRPSSQMQMLQDGTNKEVPDPGRG